MKILHTSDIHIKEFEDDSWETLKSLIKIGKKEKIDFFVVSGDLFDKEVGFSKLYHELRPLLDNIEYEFIIIPGNHDEKAFSSGAFIGNKVRVIRNLTEPLEYESVRFFGFPFKNITSKEIRSNLRKIKELSSGEKTNILLFHGELLDHSFSGSDFGDEEINYMGVKLSFFTNLNLKYVLAGHFHTNFQVYEFDQGGFFVYPGSPLSKTKKEMGKRAVNLFELGKAPSQYIIDTPYYEQINLKVQPEDKTNIIDKIKEQLKEIPGEAKILLSLTGYTEKNEEEFDKEIHKLEDKFKNLEIENRTRGIKQLTDDELFKTFLEKLERLKSPREQEIKSLFIKSMLESGE
jgi:DNA repair exonuclease SbcCD nuclease subunit